jgi:hypothetical protein
MRISKLDCGINVATMYAMTTEQQIIADEEQRSLAYEQTAIYKGFKVADLRIAFDKVCDPKDWKGPVAAWVLGEGVLVTVAAIEFFTATNPTVNLNTETMRYLIESEGYRNGPAGDH